MSRLRRQIASLDAARGELLTGTISRSFLRSLALETCARCGNGEISAISGVGDTIYATTSIQSVVACIAGYGVIASGEYGRSRCCYRRKVIGRGARICVTSRILDIAGGEGDEVVGTVGEVTLASMHHSLNYARVSIGRVD